MINLWFLWWNLGGNLKKMRNLVDLLDTIQYNTIQYNTIQYNTIQYDYLVDQNSDTIQYNTIQYKKKINRWMQYD